MAIIRMTMAEILKRKPTINREKMLATTEEDIIRHMIEDGEDPNEERVYRLVVHPKELRKKLNMTQTEFATALHVPLKTLRNWEQMRVRPDPAACSLLRIVAKNPTLAFEALKQNQY